MKVRLLKQNGWSGRCGFSAWCGLMVMGMVLGQPCAVRAEDEKTFATPQAAVDALTAAIEAKDTNALHAMFGPSGHQLVSPDAVEATNDFNLFAKRLKEKATLVKVGESTNELDIGADSWPFPIPLVNHGGGWFFDTDAGREEIMNRRIGADELQTIQVCHAYVEAQREYASELRDGSDVLQYAQLLRSSPGKRDGLYWKVEPGEELSPLGPLIAEAHNEGYRHSSKIMTSEPAPYHGYYFKILTKQGRHAPGGKYNYIINGHMIAGFALVAWPEQWNNTGVMTFIVNQQGKVYQKNLGPKTDSIAPGMATFDPDSSWTWVGAK